jgi:hypothetical protein
MALDVGKLKDTSVSRWLPTLRRAGYTEAIAGSGSFLISPPLRAHEVELRIRRTWGWKTHYVPIEQRKLGPDSSDRYYLESTDVLEYKLTGWLSWRPVPMVEDPHPVHPHMAQSAKDLTELSRRITEALVELRDQTPKRNMVLPEKPMDPPPH